MGVYSKAPKGGHLPLFRLPRECESVTHVHLHTPSGLLNAEGRVCSLSIINSRRACAERVTVVGSVCLSVLQLDCLFVPQTIQSTELLNG